MKQLSAKIASSSKNEAFTQATIQEIFELIGVQQPQYQNFDYIGDGSSSLILKTSNHKNEWVALKVIAVQKNIEEIERLKRKYNILQEMSKLSYFVSVNNSFYLRDDIEEKYFIIEMELCQNTLGQLLKDMEKDDKRLDDRVKIFLTIQLLDALHSLHKKEIMHRNIKPSNILVSHHPSFKDTPFILKIGDIGLTSQLKASKLKSFLSDQKVTANYLSIEASEGKERIESDLFSLGIVLIELDNHLTFDYSKVNHETFTLLQREGISALAEFNLNRKSALFELASILLNSNYKKRSSALEVLQQFLQQKQYANIVVYSIITEAMTQSEVQLEIPTPNHIKQQQIEVIHSSIQDFIKNGSNPFKLEGESQMVIQNKLEDFMNKIQNEQKEMQNANLMPSENIQLALKSLYQQKRFDLFSLLESGASEIVFSVRNIILKRDSILKLSLVKDKIELSRQISILKMVFSPYIAKFFDFGYFSDEKKNEYIWLEFEKCGCTLTHYLDQNLEDIHNNPKLKEQFALQMIDSVNSLHRQGVLHGDIYLNNFLISSDESGQTIIKLANFSQSGFLNSFRYEITEQYDPTNDKPNLVEGVNCLFLRGKKGTPAFRSPERSLCNGFPSTFLSDSFSVGLCLLLLDNYISLEKLFFSSYFYLLWPYSIPLINCHHLFNKNSSIYQWAISLLSFQLSQRLYLREIVDNIKDPLIPLYSKFSSEKSLKTIDLKSTSCLHLKDIECFEIKNLINDNTARFSSLQSLTIDLSRKIIGSIRMVEFSSEIQKLIQLSQLTILLSNRKIGNEEVIILSLGISQLVQLSSIKIDLQNNQIESLGMIKFVQCISKLTKLSQLTIDLEYNQIDSEGMRELSSRISQLISLSSLTINLQSNQIESQGMIEFSSNISKLIKLSSLTIALGSNQIKKEGMIELSQGLLKLTQLSQLTLLLYNNKIKSEGMIEFSSKISKLTSLLSLTINLQGNQIENKGLIEFSQGISKFTQISQITLQLFNNKIGSEGMIEFSSSLSKLISISSLTINLSSNQIESKGMREFSQGISKLTQLSFLTLHLYNCKIGSEGMKEFSSNISRLIQLQQLTINLSQNQIGSEGMIEFSSGISKLIKLSSLAIYLLSNQIGSQGMIEFSSGISKLIQLSSLRIDLSSNQIGSEGIIEFQQGIQKLISLSSFTILLQKNKIESKGMIKFSSGISKLIKLSSLVINLNNNQIDSKNIEELRSIIESQFAKSIQLKIYF